MNNLKQQIKKVLICDKGCGHTLDPDLCFKHQCERIEKIIAEATTELKEKIIERIEKVKKKDLDFGISIEDRMMVAGFNQAISEAIEIVKKIK